MYEKSYPKVFRILMAFLGTIVLGVFSSPIWIGLMVSAHYSAGPYDSIAKVMIIPFLFTLMMTVLVFCFGKRFNKKRFWNIKRYLILPAIIILESIIFELIFKFLQVPYLWLDGLEVFEPVHTNIAMIVIYPTIIIIAAFVADAGLSFYNKFVLDSNRVQNEIET